jgi:SPP1 family predicted phage head-tail adaptor
MKYNKNEVTGKMRDRIILQNVNRSRSLTGFASESWADTATIWAFAESKLPGSNETIIDGKNTAKNVCDFTIRYISTITEESRVVWGDKLYQVKNLKVSHDRRFISFQGVFYDSYILTGVNVAASVTGIATTSANLKLIMSVIGQANAIASAIGEITTAQQGLVEVASSVVANGTSTANVTKVIPINSGVAASANVSAAATIVQNITSSVQAAAISTADVQLIKVIASSVTANATATSAIDVIQQGLVTFEASVTATGTTTADILRIATLQSSASTTADTSAIASLTKVLEATATATAQTSSDAQLTLAVNAAATTTAVTSADAQLSYTVNATADATAQTSADAFITRIISADATATANSSAEAGIGVTFVAAAVASASVTSASVTTVDNVAASVSGAATVTNANMQLFDPYFSSVSLLLHGNGTDGSTSFIDSSSNSLSVTATGNAQIDTAIKQFGTGSLLFDGNGDNVAIANNSILTLGTGDFTIELWIYPLSQPGLFNSIIGGNATGEPIVNLRGSGTSSSISFNIFGSADIFNFNYTFTQNNWYHIAISRSGTSLKVYINGSQIGSTITDSTNISSPLTTVGGLIVLYSQYFNGNIDDVRITKGVARYTGSSLTVPTREFLDQ